MSRFHEMQWGVCAYQPRFSNKIITLNLDNVKAIYQKHFPDQPIEERKILFVLDSEHSKDDADWHVEKCPHHADEHPSLVVNRKTGKTMCLLCNRRGKKKLNAAFSLRLVPA